MAAMSIAATTCCSSSFPANPRRHIETYSRAPRLPLPRPAWRRSLLAASPPASRLRTRTSLSASPAAAHDYEFTDTNGEVELRLDIGKLGIESSRDVFVDVDDMSLLIRAKSDGTLRTLMNVGTLFDRVKSSETIWFIDEDQLVVNLKKVEQELKWPDIDESWKSLTAGITQLLTGISVHIVGDSTDINEAVAKEIAEGIGYLPVCTSELLESATQKSVDTWAASEGVDSVAEAECVVLESLSSHVRTVVATLGGKQGAASRFDKWQYLHSGFTVWLSVSDAGDEASAKEEARRSVSTGSVAYAKADVVVKLGGWDPEYTRDVAQGCLVALKQLTLADKKLAVGNQSQPFMHSVHSPMLSGAGTLFDGDGDDDDRVANPYEFSQSVLHTPPPPSTQETQTDEVVYGRGNRQHRPAPQRLSPSGPRPRKIQTRRRPQQ